MPKIEPGDMKYRLLHIRTINKVTQQNLIKDDLTHKAAEALQAEIISRNKEKYESLIKERRECDEGVDSPEKRGNLKKFDNALAELQYPSKESSFAIERDRDAENKAAEKNAAAQRRAQAGD